MSNGDSPETPLSRAIKKREELQALIKASMQELEKIDLFLKMYRDLLTPEETVTKGELAKSPSTGAHAGRFTLGQAQPIFEQFVRAVLRDVQRPLDSSEV